MNYQECIHYLEEDVGFSSIPGLERIQYLCDLLGNPEQRLPVIHVAGTNGKGSAVAMLSSILNSEVAIEINISIMRAFIAVRQLIANPPPDKHSLLQKEVKELKQYIEEIFTDQNDINEDTRMQLELINQTLAELQVHQKLSDKPYRPIGFIRPEED